MFAYEADIIKERNKEKLPLFIVALIVNLQEQTDINMRFNDLYVIDCKNNFRVSTGSVAHLNKKELLKVHIPHMLSRL